jgi:hypothetical protein
MYESIGTSGTADTYDGRATAELELGIAFLKSYIGDPPSGCRLEIVEHEHDLGVYATICLCWDVGTLGKGEWDYYRRCEEGLRVLNDSVNWLPLADFMFQDATDESDSLDEDNGADPD